MGSASDSSFAHGYYWPINVALLGIFVNPFFQFFRNLTKIFKSPFPWQKEKTTIFIFTLSLNYLHRLHILALILSLLSPPKHRGAKNCIHRMQIVAPLRKYPPSDHSKLKIIVLDFVTTKDASRELFIFPERFSLG